MALAALLLQQPGSSSSSSRAQTPSDSTVSAVAGSSPRAGSLLHEELAEKGRQAPRSALDLLDAQHVQHVDPRRSLRALECLPEVACAAGGARRDAAAGAAGSHGAGVAAQGILGALAREEQLVALQQLAQHLADTAAARRQHKEQAVQASPPQSEAQSSSSGAHGSEQGTAGTLPAADSEPSRSAEPAWMPDRAAGVHAYPVDSIARMHAAGAWLSAQQQPAGRPQGACDEARPAAPAAACTDLAADGCPQGPASSAAGAGSTSGAQHAPEQDAGCAEVPQALPSDASAEPAQPQDLQAAQQAGSNVRGGRESLFVGEHDSSVQRESSAELQAAIQDVLAGEDPVHRQSFISAI